MLRHVDLCSGIGGFALGFEWAELSKPVLFCDIEPWSRQILAKHWPDVPIAEDVKELANDPTRIIHAIGDRPSILTAGYPCQPFSQAGQRRGSEDDRHIWPEIFSIVQQVRPNWLVCENVSGHITMGLDEVLSDLADKANYAVQTFHLGALAVDAPHRRMRLWIVARNMGNAKHDGYFAEQILRSNDETSDKWRQKKQTQTRKSEGTDRSSYATSIRRSQSQSQQSRVQEGDRATDVADTRRSGCCTRGNIETRKKTVRSKPPGFTERSGQDVADTQSMYSNGSGKHTEQGQRQEPQSGDVGSEINTARSNWWLAEPRVGRVAHGIPRRVDRLRGLGNAIVPQIAMRIGQTIKATYDA